MNNYIFVIILYSVGMVGVGFWLNRKVKSAGDFFIAGRSLNAKKLFITLLAANIGAGSTVGVAGLAYRYGTSAWWWVGASGLGSLILAFWIGPKIYQVARRKGYLTLGDYLEDRYSKSFRGVTSFFMGIGTLAIFSGQLIGIAWILQVVAGFPKTWGVALGAGVVVLYSMFGGLMSAAGVNYIQVIIMVFGFVFATIAALLAVDGFSGLIEKVEVLSHAGGVETSSYVGVDGMGITAILGFFLMLTPSFFISPGLIGKIYGAENEEAVMQGTAWNGIAQWAFGALIVILGMCVYAIFPSLANPELALPTAVIELMPFWISALALAAIFSAEVSTADAVLYMVAGAWANDLIKGVFKTDLSDGDLLKVSRIVMACGGIVGIFLALQLPDIISSLSIFYTLMSVSLTAPVLFGLFSKQADSRGAIASSVSGVLVTVYFQFLSPVKGVWILNAQSTGILVSILVLAVHVWVKNKAIGEKSREE